MCGGGAKKFFTKALDVVTQVSTGGTVGFDNDGFGGGVTTDVLKQAGEQLILDPLKDITGARAAEDANARNEARFAEEQAEAQRQRQESQNQSARDQLQASRLAGSARGGVSTQNSNQRRISRFSQLGSDERDFLGL